jgi:ASC-1-like (ASCH) protein
MDLMTQILDFPIKEVVVRVIPHRGQRYETVGDWVFSGDRLNIFVSDMRNDDYHQLVAIHEYVEAILCRKAGITEESVTAFDVEFEKNRSEGNTDEPGNDPSAPYYTQHRVATEVEKFLASYLRVDWEAYDATVNSL